MRIWEAAPHHPRSFQADPLFQKRPGQHAQVELHQIYGDSPGQGALKEKP